MKKQITLSFLIFANITHAMEKESSFPCNQISHESELIQAIRKQKNDFERQLIDDTWEQDKDCYNSDMRLSKFWSDDYNPLNFLKSCYYKYHHKMTLFKFNLPGSLLEKYKDTQIDGYSALSAAILAPNTSHDAKLDFIQDLINLDFKPTQKDTEIAKLYMYDSAPIQTYKNICIHILQGTPNSNWLTLPYDVRKEIIRLLIEFFKKDIWPLPKKNEYQKEDKTYCISAGTIQTI